MVEVQIRLTGLPPEQAIKTISVNENQSVYEMKEMVKEQFGIHAILAIQFVFKGKVLPDQVPFKKIQFDTKRDIITVMATQAGGLTDLIW